MKSPRYAEFLSKTLLLSPNLVSVFLNHRLVRQFDVALAFSDYLIFYSAHLRRRTSGA